MTEIIGQFFGILVMVGFVINSQFPKRWQMLLGLSVLNVFSSINQLTVGAGLTAAMLGIVAVVHCFINAYKVKKELPIRMWENILFSILYLSAWAWGFIKSQESGVPLYLDLMILLATICFLGSTFAPKERDIRIFTFFNSLIYFIYDAINLNVAALAKLFAMASIIVALIRYRKKGKDKEKETSAGSSASKK